MHTRVASIAIALLLTGCVSTATKTIDAQALSAVRQQSVVHTVRDKPSFTTMTLTSATFGAVGAVAAVSEGNRIIGENDIADPAKAITMVLAKAMQSSQGVQLVNEPLHIDSEEPARIADLAKGKARFVLDVRTTGWMLGYFPTNWTHYRVMYAAKARLIDVDSRQVLAEAFCKQTPESAENAPSYDEMVAAGAARLKAELAAAANICSENLSRDMLGLHITGVAPVRTAATDGAPAATAPLTVTTASAAIAKHWRGIMACDARGDGRPNGEAYEAKFTVEVEGATISLSRRSVNVVETLSGKPTSNRLELQGTGYRIGEQTRPWRLEFSGAFAPGATVYQGKGAMLSNGRRLRTCELRMMKV